MTKMRGIACGFAAMAVLMLAVAPAWGQVIQPTAAGVYVGTLTATASSCTATGTVCVIAPVNSTVGAVAIQVSGTFSATLTFEVTVDGTHWVAAAAAAPAATEARVTTATAAGLWQMNTAGYDAVRVRCSAFTSGSAAVTIRRAIGPPGNGS